MNAATSIQTFTGAFFDPLRPDPGLIRIEDIAHALSQQCRFSGHTRRLYSVAEHSLRVSWLCPQELRLEALLHDAAEAYLIDLPRPLKHAPGFEAYREADQALELAIAERFGLGYPWPQPVKRADNLMLHVEADALLHGTAHWEHIGRYEGMRPHIEAEQYAELVAAVRSRPFTISGAKSAFLAMFEQLRRDQP